jgi:hypothetical protein
VKIAGQSGKLPGTYQGRRGPRPSAKPSTARGRFVLPIFIRQGRPRAMNHLSAIEGSAPCGPAFPQVASERQGRSNPLLATVLERCKQTILCTSSRNSGIGAGPRLEPRGACGTW